MNDVEQSTATEPNASETATPAAAAPRAWQPLEAVERRVLGVLVEKAKTTPDAYPMSLNALCTGCNQKNNRDPVTQLTTEEVEESLARLRPLGAVEEVQGSGRVARYRHHLYEWLGVDKVELAVMAELLLRGAQTEGELRGRAARMEPIADVSALRPILASLKQKGLVVSLTSQGRGHVVSHALYPADELEKLKSQHGSESTELRPSTEPGTAPARSSGAVDSLRAELAETRAQVAQLREDLDNLTRRLDEVLAGTATGETKG
jgi:uncharacterized protein YceH (UPF0502 family)